MDLLRSAAFDHGRLMSRPVSYRILNRFCCVKLRSLTVLTPSRYVTVITVNEVYRYKMSNHGDKFLHIGAVCHSSEQ